MKIIAVEANIGAGKSTLLQPLASELTLLTDSQLEVILEPVDSNPEFHRLLKQFINNPTDADKRIEFQKFITNNRQALLKDIPDGNYIIERSLFSDLIFSQMNFLSMERPSAHYMDYYYDIKKRLTDYPHIDCVLYLDRHPEACAESIHRRAREGEYYDIEYLRDLKRFHDACLPQIAREYNTKLLTLDLGFNYPSPRSAALNLIGTLKL